MSLRDVVFYCLCSLSTVKALIFLSTWDSMSCYENSACSPLQGWGWQLPALQGRSSALLLCAEIPSLQEQHCVKPSQFHLECTNRRVTSHILVPPNCWGCSHLNVFSYWLRKCLPFWWRKNSGSLAVTQSCAFLNLCKLRGATDTWSAQRPHLLLRGNIPCPTDEARSMY